jgi:hypothetical protein
MMHSKRVVEMISRVVRQGTTDVALGDVWSRIKKQHNIGTVKGRRLLLDHLDRKALRSLLTRTVGWDPHVAGSQVQGSRAELASSTRDEKLSGEAVAKSLVLVAAPSGELALRDGIQRILPGCLLAVPAEAMFHLTRIIVVENLQAMLDAHRYQLPEELIGVPFVFRGSPQFSIAAVTVLAELMPEVFYFPDADPQGLANSLGAANCKGILSCSADALQAIYEAGRSKPDDYTNQQRLMPGLLATGHPLAEIIKQYRAGFSQESMLGQSLVFFTNR